MVGLVGCAAEDARNLLTVTANGYGKRTPLAEYLVQQEDGTLRVQGRGGKGAARHRRQRAQRRGRGTAGDRRR